MSGRVAPQRIKILQVSSSLGIGGAERLLPGLSQQLDHERFDVHVCSLSSHAPLRDEFEKSGIPVHIIGVRRFYEPRAALDLARLVRQLGIDVIHTHLSEADIVGRLVGSLLNVPVVSTMHNVPSDYKRQKIHRRLPQRLTARYLATRLVGVSPRIRDAYIREWHIPAERIVSIRNAVPMAPYLAIPAGVPDTQGNPVITNIAQMKPQKGQSLLLDAARLVLQQRPDVRFQFVGGGALEEQLKAQAQTLGIEKQVIFAGVQRDLPGILANSDVFVLSSLWEGLPVTAVEAMAAARPSVLTDVGGCADLLDSGVEGLLVPTNNAPALADALLELVNNPAQRITMGEAARARVQRDFSMERYIAQHEALYLSVLRNPQRFAAGFAQTLE